MAEPHQRVFSSQLQDLLNTEQEILLEWACYDISQIDMGFSINGDTPKKIEWLMRENPMKIDDLGSSPIFRKPPYHDVAKTHFDLVSRK